ncbi:MAG: hypothetical protein II593_01010 [Prevotella sp.]|nr:hypothetical protein [Prevotella sp.]
MLVINWLGAGLVKACPVCMIMMICLQLFFYLPNCSHAMVSRLCFTSVFVKNLGNRTNNLYPMEWKIKSGHLPETLPIVLE